MAPADTDVSDNDIEELLVRKDFQNWILVMLGMKEVTEAIKHRLLSDFNEFFNQIEIDLNLIPSCANCNDDSSVVDCMESSPHRSLCRYCDTRVNKLETYMKCHVRNWAVRCRLSISAPMNNIELLDIFLRLASNFRGNPTFETMLSDLSCLCQMLRVCKFYDDDPYGEDQMKKMKELRDDWAHKGHMFRNHYLLNDDQKSKCFEIMYNVFDVQFMNPVKDTCLNILTEIENRDMDKDVLKAAIGNLSLRLDTFDESLRLLQVDLGAVLREIMEIEAKLRSDHGANNAAMIRQLSDDTKAIKHSLYKLPKHILLCVLLVLMCIVCAAGFLHLILSRTVLIKRMPPFPVQGCPNEVNQAHYFRLRFDSQNDSHLRAWIYDDVERYLSDIKTSAVLLIAEEGYGLTTISKQLICADERAKSAFNLKKKLLAYHICKFNYKKTHTSENLIRNLKTMIRRQIPKYEEYLLEFSQEIDGAIERCEDDIFTCFKEVIQIPLNNIYEQDEMVIVVDALDECGVCPHSVLRLITRILTDEHLKLPDWVKFVLTSKYHNEVTDVLDYSYIKHMVLSNVDPRHLKLLENYVWRNIGFPVSKRCVNHIVKSADGSFLCLADDLNQLTSTCEYRNNVRDASCLGTKFQTMFERSFKAKPDVEFTRIRSLLEVLAASFDPLDLSIYRDIAVKCGIDIDYEFHRALRNMNFFLRITSQNKVALRHKNLKTWLTSENRRGKLFYVSEKSGHKTIARYFLSENNYMSFRSQINPVDLARHVILAEDKHLVSIFKVQYQKLLENEYKTQWEEILQGNFDRANSEALITLLLLNSEKVSLDNLAFNASVINEPMVLYTLLQLGANARYISNSPEIRVRYKNETRDVKIEDGSWNMLHIAARYGYVSVISVLMNYDEELVYMEHAVEGNAFQIAMKYQGENVLRKMLLIDRKLASIESMLFAASEGYTSAIRVLLEFGAPNQCVECNKTVNWVDRDKFYFGDNFNKLFYLSRIQTDRTERELFIGELGSDIWKLTCITPLDVAIIYGHFNAFRLLLDNNTALAHCRHYLGFTPIVTASRYDQLKMFAYLLDIKGVKNDKCKTFNHVLRYKLISMVCADKRTKLKCEKQGMLLPEWLEYCPNNMTLQTEIGKYAHRGAMLDVYQRSEQTTGISTYMYYAVCKESSFQTLFKIAGCFSNLTYLEISHIKFNDHGVCNVEEFILRPTDVSCKVYVKKTVEIQINKRVRKELRVLGGLDKYSVVSNTQRYRMANYPDYLKLLRLMHAHNDYIPNACFCIKLYHMENIKVQNTTHDLAHMYSWTVEGMTFLKFPRLFVLCQQYHILKQVSRENPWRIHVQSYLKTNQEHGNTHSEIHLLELPGY